MTEFDEIADALEALGARRAQMMGRPMLAFERQMFACLQGNRLALKLGAGSTAFERISARAA